MASGTCYPILPPSMSSSHPEGFLPFLKSILFQTKPNSLSSVELHILPAALPICKEELPPPSHPPPIPVAISLALSHIPQCDCGTAPGRRHVLKVSFKGGFDEVGSQEYLQLALIRMKTFYLSCGICSRKNLNMSEPNLFLLHLWTNKEKNCYCQNLPSWTLWGNENKPCCWSAVRK